MLARADEHRDFNLKFTIEFLEFMPVPLSVAVDMHTTSTELRNLAQISL